MGILTQIFKPTININAWRNNNSTATRNWNKDAKVKVRTTSPRDQFITFARGPNTQRHAAGPPESDDHWAPWKMVPNLFYFFMYVSIIGFRHMPPAPTSRYVSKFFWIIQSTMINCIRNLFFIIFCPLLRLCVVSWVILLIEWWHLIEMEPHTTLYNGTKRLFLVMANSIKCGTILLYHN